MGEKKSFQIYFDNLSGVEQLSRQQRGDLFLALMRYAKLVAGEPAVSAESFLRGIEPPLDPLTGVVFLFMATSISRDTQKWYVQMERDRQRREEKRRAAAGNTAEIGGTDCMNGHNMVYFSQ